MYEYLHAKLNNSKASDFGRRNKFVSKHRSKPIPRYTECIRMFHAANEPKVGNWWISQLKDRGQLEGWEGGGDGQISCMSAVDRSV